MSQPGPTQDPLWTQIRVVRESADWLGAAIVEGRTKEYERCCLSLDEALRELVRCYVRAALSAGAQAGLPKGSQ